MLGVVDLGAYTDNRMSPQEAILRAQIADKRFRHGVLHEITIDSELTIEGRPSGMVNADVVVLPRRTYDRLRAYQRRHKALDDPPSPTVQPIDSALVGRRFHQNVAIGKSAAAGLTDGECRYTAIIDQRHPCFFDHPLDHVPGALIMEIYRQAAIATATGGDAQAASSAVITLCEVHMADFAELEAQVECRASIVDRQADGSVRLAATLHQLDRQIGDGRVELRFAADAGGS